MEHCPSCAATVTQLVQKFFNAYKFEVLHHVQNSHCLSLSYSKNIQINKFKKIIEYQTSRLQQ